MKTPENRATKLAAAGHTSHKARECGPEGRNGAGEQKQRVLSRNCPQISTLEAAERNTEANNQKPKVCEPESSEKQMLRCVYA